jgi:hypothetical protein
MARNKAVGEWVLRKQVKYAQASDFDSNRLPATIVIEQADMLDTKYNHRYEGGAYRVRLVNVPDMRTKTFLGEFAHHSAARYAHDAASKCGDWRWWPDL